MTSALPLWTDVISGSPRHDSRAPGSRGFSLEAVCALAVAASMRFPDLADVGPARSNARLPAQGTINLHTSIVKILAMRRVMLCASIVGHCEN